MRARFAPMLLLGAGPDIWPWTEEALVAGIREFGIRRDVEPTEARPSVLDGGGRYAHYVCPPSVVRQHIPVLTAWYGDMLGPLSDLLGFGLQVHAEDNDVTMKLYDPGDEQGEHLDTNGVTVLAYLTDASDAPTMLLDAGRWRGVAGSAGDVLVFDGRYSRHYVPATQRPRVTVSFNYSAIGDSFRPAEIGSIVYGTR